jgi:2-dehydro-3-deoxyphosphogluconate aldolase/(4S)-4-hydroxy-2-oxoglutarate aldolase
MKTEQEVSRQLLQQALLPLFYHSDESTSVNIASALYNAGIRSIEFTNRGEKALQNFKVLLAAREVHFPGLLLGAGTIKNAEDAKAFIEAGADFLVSPVFDAGVCDAAYLNKILWIPGCTTPTEINVADQAGCKIIKIFPGDLLKPSYIKAIKPLFPKLLFMVTGGVKPSEGNLKKWFTAGAAIVGLGSALISSDAVESNDFDSIQSKTRDALITLHHLRHS